MAILTSLLAGVVFGIGLTVSGMINPAKVIGFLDFAGDWDPTLAFVMGGALLVTIPGFAVARRRDRPVLGDTFHLPSKQTLDARLIGGAVLFGIGWGLGGFCPGPALAAVATGLPEVILFVAAMAVGMLLFRLLPQP